MSIQNNDIQVKYLNDKNSILFGGKVKKHPHTTQPMRENICYDKKIIY